MDVVYLYIYNHMYSDMLLDFFDRHTAELLVLAAELLCFRSGATAVALPLVHRMRRHLRVLTESNQIRPYLVLRMAFVRKRSVVLAWRIWVHSPFLFFLHMIDLATVVYERASGAALRW